jgi:PAS domain S-box-containing protein
MTLLQRLLPNTLVGRVLSLYLVSLLVFLSVGLGLFYKYQFSQYIDEELLAAEMIMSVAAPSVADSAILGDYDTISKTLERIIARSRFAKAQFIDTNGGIIRAENPIKVSVTPPDWLRSMVQDRLFDVNHNIAVGGKDYGVMRLSFADEDVASGLWRLALYALALSLGALVVGVVLIRIPLKRWLGNFDRVRAREADILSGVVKVSALLDSDAPQEIRHTFDILSHAASRLSAQREEAAVTLNAITDGVITTNANYWVTYCNPAAEHLLGWPGNTLIGKDARALFPVVFAEEGTGAAWKVRRLDVTGASGNKTILDTTMSSIEAAGEGVVGHVLAFRDVTQQHALDLQLRSELEMRQRALESLRRVLDSFHLSDSTTIPALASDDLDALSTRVAALMTERELGHRALDNQKFALDQHAIVSITDLQGNITYANDRFCEISGYARSELIGVNHRVVNSGLHDVQLFRNMWNTISQGHVWNGEIRNRAKQGSLYWVSATIVPLLGVDGLPEQYIAIRTDITARKKIEAQLAEQLSFVEVLLEATPTAIYLKDTNGRYLRFNRAFEALFGIDRAQWIGKNVFDLVPGDAAAMMHAKDQELFDTNTVQTYEANFTNRKTGAVREGLYWKAPLTNMEGQVTALVGTILDVTERNLLAHELRDAKRVAEAASQAKSDFLANMSHEIRTPMNGVIGMTDLALDTSLTDIQREYLFTVKSSAQSLMVILNDILDFSKIEAGKLNIETVEFSLSTTVAETLKSINARAVKKGLSLACQLAPDVPMQVIGDPGRIRQVLTNLCDNAIKFTTHGGVTVQVQSRPVADDGGIELHLTVKDTGIGIPADKQQGVFEAFHQADASTTRKFGGTGLGLTICVRLVELMGGRIWVESEPGLGSTFHFTVRVQGAVVQPTVSRVPSPPMEEAVRPLRVLLVEDHPVNQLLATTLLKKWGHSVMLAKNGKEAVDMFPTQAWDLVLMDMQMPVMGGLDATRLIRANEPPKQHTPIVAMTANAMESDRQACLDAGMDAFVAKPFNASILQTVIRQLLTSTQS